MNIMQEYLSMEKCPFCNFQFCKFNKYYEKGIKAKCYDCGFSLEIYDGLIYSFKLEIATYKNFFANIYYHPRYYIDFADYEACKYYKIYIDVESIQDLIYWKNKKEKIMDLVLLS